MESMAIGMPRYRYYYVPSGALPGPHGAMDWLLPAILSGAGFFAIVRARTR